MSVDGFECKENEIESVRLRRPGYNSSCVTETEECQEEDVVPQGRLIGLLSEEKDDLDPEATGFECSVPEDQKGCKQGKKISVSDLSQHLSVIMQADGGKAVTANQNVVDLRHHEEKLVKLEDDDPGPDCDNHCADGINISSSATLSNSEARSRDDLGSSATTVEVFVRGLERCSHCVSQPTSNHRSSQQVADCVRDGYPSRPGQNLSKSPISLITLGPDSSHLRAFGETDAVDGEEGDLKRLPPTGEVTESLSTSNNVKIASGDQSKHTDPLPKTVSPKDLCALEMESSSSDRLTGRRKLSKTIQHLQEKLQIEMENNENKGRKHSDCDAKSPKLKRFSGKANSRFMRERSRKRSKSRASFKVLHSARKYPPVNMKELPYRHWIGAGNCLTTNSRYIVSSTGICIAKTGKMENSCEAGEVAVEAKSPGVTSETDSNQIPPTTESNTGVECKKQPKPSEEEATNAGQLSTDANASSIQIKQVSDSSQVDQEDKTFYHDGNGLMAKQPDLSPIHSGHAINNSREPCSHSARLALMDNSNITLKLENDKGPTESEKFSKSSSPNRTRSRCIRRTSLGTNKRIRPPTPHSEYFCASTDQMEQSYGTSQTLATSTQKILDDEETNSNFRDEQTLKLSDRRFDKSCQGRSSSSRVRQKNGSPSKQKLTTYGNMRASKMFVSASKQQQKSADFKNRLKRTACSVQSNKVCGALLDTGLGCSPCEVISLLSEDQAHHGSLETVWSDVSTTTYESSVKTESSSSWYCKDITPENRDVTPMKERRGHVAPPYLARAERAGAATHLTKSSQCDGYTRKYTDVRAVVDFKGALPGQLSFRKGQMIKQLLVFDSPAFADGMSYGYYRAGALKRKKKGLFPSSCVAPL